MCPAGPRDFKPRLTGSIDWANLHLSAEEGFLLSRIDGETSLTNLGHLTNLKPEQVKQVLQRLVSSGLVERESVPTESFSATSGSGSPAPAAPAPSPPRTPPLARANAPAPVALDLPVQPLFMGIAPDPDEATCPDLVPPFQEDGTANDASGVATAPMPVEPGQPPLEVSASFLEPVTDEATAESPAPPEAVVAEEPLPAPQDESPAEEEPPATPETSSTPEELVPPVPEDQPVDTQPTEDEHNYRKVFETQLHPLSADERQARASKATGPELMAFCYDPEPAVILAVLENALSGLDHARLIAFAHHTGAGLEFLGKRNELLRDAQVHRRLLGNMQLSEPLYKKICGGKRLLDLFKLGNDREVTEKVRTWSRNQLRSKFGTAAAEERVEFIIQTEGRAMPQLVGLTLDSQTTALMCRRQYHSALLIQNLARFPGCHPHLLLHLLKQPLVKRQAHLRTMLLQHPNMPSDAKHRMG